MKQYDRSETAQRPLLWRGSTISPAGQRFHPGHETSRHEGLAASRGSASYSGTSGLGDVKLDLHDTAQYLCAFHIVILAETQSVSVSIPPEYHQYEIPAARPGAKGEGICLLVHPDIAHGVSLWRRMPSTPALWLILRTSIKGADSDIYLGGVYIPPAQSALLQNSTAADRFTALAEAALAAPALGKVMLMGDC